MVTILSVMTAVKDYVQIVHKLIESDPNFSIKTYTDLGAILTYVIITIKSFCSDLLSFNWLQNIGNLPIIIPDITSAMISEISVLDGYFHNAFTFLETPVSYGNENLLFYCLEKLTIGIINSLFLCLPTSIAHLICIRRFVMQGIEAGYIAGLGTLTGNVLWLASIIFGWRFLVIPWLSLDIFRYILGFVLLVKYMWDSYTERRMVLEDVSKSKIFVLNFLLAFTEQTNIYPFLSNISVGSDATIFENFASDNLIEFISIHSCYLLGITLGSLSLLYFTCWFWENPAFKIYMWMISSFKVTTGSYYKLLNFSFLYLTMISAISSMTYFGLDYTLTKPFGLVHNDRLVDQKVLLETSFLGTKASDRNTRRNRGRRGRRERWKRRVRKYRTFDASLYDQGIYDLLTIEDLNYGFDRFWLRRKIRNHRVHFRFFPGPWMRSFKKQLTRPRLESFNGPRMEFFRILFEQMYHPSFHEVSSKIKPNNLNLNKQLSKSNDERNLKSISEFTKQGLKNSKILTLSSEKLLPFYSDKQNNKNKLNLMNEMAVLRKFTSKVNTRIKTSKIALNLTTNSINKHEKFSDVNTPIYSKRWKHIFSKLIHKPSSNDNFVNLYKNILLSKSNNPLFKEINNKSDVTKNLSKKDRQILRYKTLLTTSNSNNISKPLTLLHPIKFYLHKEQAFRKKYKFYGANVFRNFGIENNAPYFRTMMRKFFYYYKPTLRWERTMHTASLRKSLRKGPRTVLKFNPLISSSGQKQNSTNSKIEKFVVTQTNGTNLNKNSLNQINQNKIQNPTHMYSLIGKRATRYRHQIYKDVLQHWYYTPFNRFLVKLDVDNFIRRQPMSHFVTKKEERLLHIRRFLLADHYETLRWYTYMQHYRSMKTRIGGTKSFASRMYNQQFMGTFKKVRHLFSITPSLGENNVLKFDQPLYNEFNNLENSSFLTNNLIHEELLADNSIYNNNKVFDKQENNVESLNPSKITKFSDSSNLKSALPEDLLTQSTKILREYILQATPIRQELIKTYLKEKNYWDLTLFLFKGQKTRGNRVITNYQDFLQQEKNYLFTQKEKIETDKEQQKKLKQLIKNDNIKQNIWLLLIKKCKTNLYNQKSLKKYLIHKVEKREKQQQIKQKRLKNRLERIKNWLLNKNKIVFNSNLNTNVISTPNLDSSNLLKYEPNIITTGMQKALKEGIYIQQDNPQLLTKKRLGFNKMAVFPYTGNISKIENLNKRLKNQIKINLKNRNNLEKRIIKSLHSINMLIKKNGFFKPSFEKKLTNILKKVKINLFAFTNIFSKLIVNKQSKLYTTYLSKPIKSAFSLFKPNTNKTIDFWNKKNRVLSKRKKSRKEMKIKQKEQTRLTVNTENLLNNDLNNSINSNINTNFNQQISPLLGQEWKQIQKPIRKKSDSDQIQIWNTLENKIRANSWQNWKQKIKNKWNQNKTNFTKLNLFGNFKRKLSARTRRRRSSRRRRNVFLKKSTLAANLNYQIKQRKKLGLKIDYEKQRLKISQILDHFTNVNKPIEDAFKLTNEFHTLNPKLKRTRQHKKTRSLKNKKLKNRRKKSIVKYSALSKMRILGKQLKRIKTNLKIQKWWYKTYLPNMQATTDTILQIEKDKQIQNKLSSLSIEDILERDNNAYKNYIEKVPGDKNLQISDKDYKPLSLPQALRIRQNLVNQKRLILEQKDSNQPLQFVEQDNKQNNKLILESKTSLTEQNSNLINKISEKVLNETALSNFNKSNHGYSSEQVQKRNNIVNVNPIPFYAGWDETLRKFVITNRLLSRTEAGYGTKILTSTQSKLNNVLQKPKVNSSLFEPFTSSALQGMNAATTLYWQVPFTTYDPDQFFKLGLDGFAPLGWRRFDFQHTKQTTKPIIVKTKTFTDINQTLILNNKNNEQNKNTKNKMSYNIKINILKNTLQNSNSNLIFNKDNTNKKYSRRIYKNYKLINQKIQKNAEFEKYSVPSGPLLNQVLPVHYIYVFYKQYRLPRDRYIGRKLRRAKEGPSFALQNSIIKLTDFTLRKRIKPQRKYHRKRFSNLKIKRLGNLLPRRRKFKDIIPLERTRPLSKQKLTQKLTQQIKEQRALKSKLKSKFKQRQKNSKQQGDNLRIRQLRQRIQRQVFRPVWRYKPRSGGFVWPGDYLRLELTQAPKLKKKTTLIPNTESSIGKEITKQNAKISSNQRKIKKNKKRVIQKWQIQPKKYLLQKHNKKVIKKRLQKSQQENKIRQKVKQLTYLFKNKSTLMP